jgi:hypothetical protein
MIWNDRQINDRNDLIKLDILRHYPFGIMCPTTNGPAPSGIMLLADNDDGR